MGTKQGRARQEPGDVAERRLHAVSKVVITLDLLHD